MTESIFDFDLSQVDEDPNNFPDGTYKAAIYKAEVVTLKEGKGRRLVFTYRLQEGEHSGKDIAEWKNIDSTASAREKAFLKQRLLSVGIPESRLSNMTTDDLENLQGTMVFIKKKQNGKYANVTDVRLDDGSSQAETQSVVTADLL